MAVVSEGTITLVGILGSKTGVRGREVKTLIALYTSLKPWSDKTRPVTHNELCIMTMMHAVTSDPNAK